MSMQDLTEEDIKLRYITPSIVNKGWSVQVLLQSCQHKPCRQVSVSKP